MGLCEKPPAGSLAACATKEYFLERAVFNDFV
jgi:hypothetical protein